jgi:CheY-like chemotaxis protein/anti-sigma regulatory factor (Ser/Thr protein kinase)
MSHEIRTPLNGVLGNIQLLEMTHLEGEQQGYAKAISTAGTSLLSLINDILDLSKLEADKLGLEAAPFGLRAAIDSVVTMQRSRALEKGLRLVLRLPPDLPETLLGDELRIRQVLMNLLSNAIKFTAAGSVTVAAAVVERTAERVQLELSVADTGIGIGPRVLGTIFEPFVQGDSSTTRRFGGTGLGLTICKRLVGLMGGSIVVESEEGVGSTFRVLAPFRVAKPKTSPTLEPAAAPGPPAPLWRGPQLRVLLAEDDPSNLGFGAALLKRMGLAATIVGDGAAALEAASAQPFDLLLLDLQMPVMDGRRAIGQLRERERATGAHVPAIALTAYSDDRGGASLLAEGFDGYLRKPLSVKLLVAEMERVLGLRREG